MTTAISEVNALAPVPFAADLRRFGDATAMIDDDRVVSYDELADRVDELAQELGEGRRLVLLRAANRVDAVCAYLACLAHGHVALLCGDDDSSTRIADAYDPDVIVAIEGQRLAVRQLRDGSVHDLHEDLCLLLSTSGTTGSPKLVRLSRENLQSNAEAIASYLAIGPGDRAITTLPMQYCYGLSVVNSYLLRGASLILTELSVVDPCFWRLFEEHGATSLAGVPHTFELLDRVGFDKMDLPTLRYVTQAGGRLDPERVRHYARLGRRRDWDFFVMYGQTEATARMAYLPPELAQEHPDAIGLPVPGGSLRVEPTPGWDDPGVGELVYDGPNVMLGYAHAPADLARGRDIEELRTGDIARRTDDGLFAVVGRSSGFIKLFGLRIDPRQVEEWLAQAGLTACCVGDDNELGVAVEGPHDAEAWRRRVAERLGLPVGAVHVTCVERLPRLASGKPDVPSIRASLDAARASAGVPADESQQRSPRDLHDLFADVLGRDVVSDEDTFVSLGGDSLSYVEMSIALEERLGDLPAGWHVTPIGQLQAGSRGAVSSRRGRRIETSVLVRAIATILIVGTHIRVFSLPGSAHVLLALAGYNFARFLMAPDGQAQRLRGQVRSIARVALPSMAWIGAVALVGGTYGAANVLLLNSIVGPHTWTDLWHFWFVEVLIYVMIAMTIVTAVPAVARAERRWPFAFAMALVAIGLLTRFRLVDTGLLHTKAVFWLFALGWAAHAASSNWQRLTVSVATVASVPGFFHDADREIIIAAGFLALVWIPHVSVPARLVRPVAILAASSLYVYLVQWQVFPLFPHAPFVALGTALAAGVGYWWIATRTMTWVERWVPRALGTARRTLTRGRSPRLYAEPADASA